MTDPQELRYGPSPSQFLLLHTPPTPGPHPLVAILHGGFWKSAYGIRPPTSASESLVPDLLARGFAVAQVEYRRSADAQWGFPHTNADAAAALALAASQPAVDAARVFVVGHSAGGTLALWCAARADTSVSRTYALAPVADLREAVHLRLSDRGDAVQNYMHGTPEGVPEAYARACPMDLADALVKVGVTVVVGKDDVDVPEPYVRRFYERVAKVAKGLEADDGLLEYKVFEGTNHYHVVQAGTEVWDWVAADMQRRAGL